MVFNDIDTLPYDDILNFSLTPGTAKHFYGFEYALGGIVAFRGADFEKTNGYPNFWGWGMEDNVLQKRCEMQNINIDRSQFFPIGSPEILQLFDGVSRFINKKDPWRATHDDGIDGIKTIHKLRYNINTESENIFMIDIASFMTRTRYEHDNYYKYDLREPPRKIVHPSKIATNSATITNDWTNIPNSEYSAPDDSAINAPHIKKTYTTPHKLSSNATPHKLSSNAISQYINACKIINSKNNSGRIWGKK